MPLLPGTTISAELQDNATTGARELVLVIPISGDLAFTSSGRALQVATTHGWQPIPGRGDLAISLSLVGKIGGKKWGERKA